MFKYNKEMFEGHEVEVAVDGDKKYYVARSVAPMFGLKNNITYQMEKHCGKENCMTISPKDWVPANTLRYKVTAITEDGFHRLVTRYQAVEKAIKQAENEVHFVPSKPVDSKTEPEPVRVNAMEDQKADLIKLLQQNDRLEQQVAELRAENKGLAQMMGEVLMKLNSMSGGKPHHERRDHSPMKKSLPRSVNVTALAKPFGYTATELNQLLWDLKIQKRTSKGWELEDPYRNQGYTVPGQTYERDGKNITQMRWTEKGVSFIIDKLSSMGIHVQN